MNDLPKKLRDASHPYRCIVGPDGETTLMEVAADEIESLTAVLLELFESLPEGIRRDIYRERLIKLGVIGSDEKGQ